MDYSAIADVEGEFRCLVPFTLVLIISYLSYPYFGVIYLLYTCAVGAGVIITNTKHTSMAANYP